MLDQSLVVENDMDLFRIKGTSTSDLEAALGGKLYFSSFSKARDSIYVTTMDEMSLERLRETGLKPELYRIVLAEGGTTLLRRVEDEALLLRFSVESFMRESYGQLLARDIRNHGPRGAFR